ncbi:MAG: regulatory protein GemA [Azonexus sp.]|jgi:phage gp16-like protein|nr:regulatory protein GemA [Azonexus sp.]
MNSRPPPADDLIFGSKIALIHKAARDLNMADESYRALLLRTAGVTTSKAITLSRFDAVMREFRRLGFVDAPRKPKAAGGSAPGRPTTRQWGLLAYRARLVGFAGLEDPRFIAWMKRRGHVDHPRFLDQTALQRVLAALGNWAGKKANKLENHETKGVEK